MNTKQPKTTLATAIGALALLTLTSCAAPGADADTTPSSAADTVTITDVWVKSADDGMSAAFGELENTGDVDATIVSAATDASPMVGLHETVENEAGEMVMREKDGGFTVPAGGSLTLEPGGNHIMLMDLTAPVKAGDEVTFTLTFSDDSTLEFTAPAKDYSGANENYEGGEMEMGGDDE